MPTGDGAPAPPSADTLDTSDVAPAPSADGLPTPVVDDIPVLPLLLSSRSHRATLFSRLRRREFRVVGDRDGVNVRVNSLYLRDNVEKRRVVGNIPHVLSSASVSGITITLRVSITFLAAGFIRGMNCCPGCNHTASLRKLSPRASWCVFRYARRPRHQWRGGVRSFSPRCREAVILFILLALN